MGVRFTAIDFFSASSALRCSSRAHALSKAFSWSSIGVATRPRRAADARSTRAAGEERSIEAVSPASMICGQSKTK
jgi:hypothetical protein